MEAVSLFQGRSLSGKLLRILLSLMVLAILALFLVLELDFYRSERARLIESLARLVDMQGAAIAGAVWEFDLDRIHTLLTEQSRLPFFQAAVVRGKGGEVLASAGDPEKPPRSPNFRLEYTLQHKLATGTMILGQWVVTVHDDGILAVMIQHLKVNGAILLTLLAALAAGTLFGVRVVIGRPLEEFRRAIERPMEAQIETPLQWERNDELGKMLGAYNAMLEARNQAEMATRQRETQLREAVRVAQEANAESARFNHLAIGRELRVIELKGRLNDLARELNQPLPFDILSADDAPLADRPSAEDSKGDVSLKSLLGTTDMQSLFEDFCNAVGVASAIIDLEGNILVAARWQRVCTDFHRVNNVTCARCIESDTDLSSHLQKGENYAIYRCRNGLTDAASPITVNGQHLANVFIGQFLVAPPDNTFFGAQAREVGFNQADYLAAIAEAPVIAEERLPSILGFLSRFANLLATLAMEKILTTMAQISMHQGKLAALNLAEDTELARKELSAYKDQLEERVADRTKALRVSEERMRSIIENAVDGIVVIGPDGIVQSFSPAAERIFGYTAYEVIGRNVSQLMPKPMADEHDGYIGRYLTTGKPRVVGYNREIVGRHKDGHEFPMDLAVGEAILGNERIFTGILRDITDRKRAETALVNAEERTRLLLTSVGEGIFGVDAGGYVTFINPSGAKMLGYHPDEVVGQRVHPFIHHTKADGSDYPIEECLMYQSSTAGISGTREDEVLWRKDGSSFPVLYNSVPVRNSQNKLVGAVVVFHDIADRLRAQEKISAYFKNSTDALLVLSPTRGFLDANPSAIAMFGFESIDDLLEVGPASISPETQPDGRPSLEEAVKHMQTAFTQKHSQRFDWVHRRADGTTFPCEVTLMPILLGGEPQLIASVRDITERKRAEDEILHAKQIAEDAMEVIFGSIQYASRIQHSILPLAHNIKAAFPEYFVVWEPRDVVGGDMYWCRPWGDGHLVMLGDCTGHGVPGAFMTLIANGALGQAYREAEPGNPAQLIRRMHQLIQSALGQHRAEGESDDGIELGACYIPTARDRLIFAGARFSLF